MARFTSFENADTWNMNFAWLAKISAEIDKFIYSRYYNDFDSMYIALDNLEMLSSPKIDDDKIEKILKWLEENKDRWRVVDPEGSVVRVNEANRKKLLKVFKECFRHLLIRLDEEGILTKLKYDPNQAMSNFKSS